MGRGAGEGGSGRWMGELQVPKDTGSQDDS